MKKLIIGLCMLAGGILVSCQNRTGSAEADRTGSGEADRTGALRGDSLRYESDNLIVKQLSDHVFQHISYLNTGDFGKVPCNGMIVVKDHEAIVFDTPTNVEGSVELVRYLTETMDYTVKAVVATHFHVDCVAGLAEFHAHQIPSYANGRTISLLKARDPGAALPQHGFQGSLELTAGGEVVLAGFFGEGHTPDNVIGYYPKGKVIFGGCLVKEVGAGEGNLADANVGSWPQTIENIRAKYPEAELVIPGHGAVGGPELLDYTRGLFSPAR